MSRSTPNGILPFHYTPAKLGLSGVTLASERTSNSFNVPGRTELTVFANLSARSAATDVKINVDASNDSGTTWFPVQSVAIAAGTGTMSDYTATKAVSAADTFEARFDLSFQLCRIRVSGTSGAAGDVVSVSALVK
jgi:hypothetical protein